LLSTQLATLINVASAYLVAGEVPVRQGTSHASIVPYQVFEAADGYLMVGAANDKLFGQLCAALGHADWTADPRFATNADRVQHRELLVGQIAAILHTDTVANWEGRLQEAGVAVAPVNNMAQVFADPQVIHSQQVVTVAHPTLGAFRMVGPAVTYSETPAAVAMPPPLLGEHTAEVLGEIAHERADR
jgi:crotonobetainyl-CoA:carnitine CoA-transferase CaiB-like acyl-CoA transferase